MKNYLSFFARIFLIAAFVVFIYLTTNCGSTNIKLNGPDGGIGGANQSSNCEEPSSAVTTDTISVISSGDPCKSPAISALDNQDVILACDTPEPGRNTDDPETDFVTVSCGEEGHEISEIYYCDGGIVYRDDGADGVELFDLTNIECVIDFNNDPILLETELIIS